MSIEVPSVRVVHEDGHQIYSMSGIIPRIPRINEHVSLNGHKYLVVDVDHRISGLENPVSVTYVVVKDEN